MVNLASNAQDDTFAGMTEFEKSFANALEALRPGPTLVAGVSGGMDSMALLELLPLSGKKIVVAHFNHQLRGAESDGDEAFVREQAAQRGLEFHSGRGDVRAEAKGISIEMAARNLRHAFLAQIALKVGGDILLAHHADDQLELLVMRAQRRVKGYGSAGMRDVSPSPADPSIRILRPLLKVRKSELRDFVNARHIPFREDSSNAQLGADRNRVRHVVLPTMREQFGCDFEATLLGKISDLRKTHDAAREFARAWTGGDFAALADSLKLEIIALQFHRAHLPMNGRILASLLQEPSRPVTIRPGQTATISATGNLQIHDPLPAPIPIVVALVGVDENRVDFSGGILRWSFSIPTDLSKVHGTMIFDAARVGGKIMLRHARPGDRIRLSGRTSARPLMDVLNKNKIPREKRRTLVVANNAEAEIFWVEGLRITEDFKVTAQTKRTLEWNWRRD